MSVSRPFMKQPRLTTSNVSLPPAPQNSPLMRTEATTHLGVLNPGDTEEVRGRRIGSVPTPMTPTPSSEGVSQNSSATGMMMTEPGAAAVAKQTEPKHPKGHRVTQLQKVWNTMDSKDFLHLTDTLVLNDVWVQPASVEPSRGAYTTAAFREIVAGPNIKQRLADHKVGTEDILKMLYLCVCLQHDMQNVARPDYTDWLNEMTAACVKELGLSQGSNGGSLCDFIINNARNFTFYPEALSGRFGIFFRKICYHSYKAQSKEGTESVKFKNMCMIKCGSSKGKFDYIIEARLFSLPDGWFDYTPVARIATEPVIVTNDPATAAAHSG